MIGGNVFSIAFGRNLDAHAPAGPALNSTAAPPPSDASHQCLQGRECYAGSLVMTTAACALALALGVYAGWRDWRDERRRRALLARAPRLVVSEERGWEDDT